MTADSLHDRLSSVSSGHTYRSLAQLTGTHPETVRRYMQGQAPSVEFLASLCLALGLNADWILTGRGPKTADQVRSHALAQAKPSELHSAMASTISTLLERVNRLESYCQTLETRVRGMNTTTNPVRTAPDPAPDQAPHSVPDAGTSLPSSEHGPEAKPQIITKATRIARAVAKRPPRDAD